MTSIATVLGLLPMAFNLGTGGEAHVPLARAVIGVLCVSTFLTLFLVPCLYAMTRGLVKAPRPQVDLHSASKPADEHGA